MCPELKTLEDATEIRRRLYALSAEGRIGGARGVDDLVIVGGGPTGVELAGAIAELARHGLDRSCAIDPAAATVVLVQWRQGCCRHFHLRSRSTRR